MSNLRQAAQAALEALVEIEAADEIADAVATAYAAPQAQQPQPFTKAQRRRLYDNSFEIHHVTFSTFSEVLDLVERAHRIGMKP